MQPFLFPELRDLNIPPSEEDSLFCLVSIEMQKILDNHEGSRRRAKEVKKIATKSIKTNDHNDYSFGCY